MRIQSHQQCSGLIPKDPPASRGEQAHARSLPEAQALLSLAEPSAAQLKALRAIHPCGLGFHLQSAPACPPQCLDLTMSCSPSASLSRVSGYRDGKGGEVVPALRRHSKAASAQQPERSARPPPFLFPL